MVKLTDKREQFAQEYLIDLCATQAYIRAGYSPRNAGRNVQRLLQNEAVRARVDELLAERSRRTGVNADRVVRELARIGLCNITDAVDALGAAMKEGASREDTAAVASIKVKVIPTESGEIVEREIKLHDKTKALELLGRHLGMFTDRLQLSGAAGVQIINDVPKSGD